MIAAAGSPLNGGASGTGRVSYAALAATVQGYAINSTQCEVSMAS
jgi:hypothetical protein